MIHRLPLFTTNAYLVQTERVAFLVDSGLPRDWEKLLRLIRSHGLEPGHLRAVLHTHGHSDHAGNSERLRREFKIPLVMHRGELERVQRGENGPLTPASWMFPFTRPFIVEKFPTFTPDLILDDDLNLDRFDFPGEAIKTPGHTRGSLTFILGNEAIVGDLVRGSLQPWNRGRGACHFFHEDKVEAEKSLRIVVNRGVTRLHPGHFGCVTV